MLVNCHWAWKLGKLDFAGCGALKVAMDHVEKKKYFEAKMEIIPNEKKTSGKINLWGSIEDVLRPFGETNVLGTRHIVISRCKDPRCSSFNHAKNLFDLEIDHTW